MINERTLPEINNYQEKVFKSDFSSDISEIFPALIKAQSEMQSAIKDTSNPFFKSKYADLAEVQGVLKDPLTNNKLGYTQLPIYENGKAGCITYLFHESGQWIKSTLFLKLSKDDPQGAGSAITYARRYTLTAMTGVSQEDDDGNKASTQEKKTVGKVQPKKSYLEKLKQEVVIEAQKKFKDNGELEGSTRFKNWLAEMSLTTDLKTATQLQLEAIKKELENVS